MAEREEIVLRYIFSALAASFSSLRAAFSSIFLASFSLRRCSFSSFLCGITKRMPSLYLGHLFHYREGVAYLVSFSRLDLRNLKLASSVCALVRVLASAAESCCKGIKTTKEVC